LKDDIFGLVLKLGIMENILKDFLVFFRGFFEDYIFAW
jgi:hypothetical protein